MHQGSHSVFLVVKFKPSMMIWSMLVQCKGVEGQAAIKETVELRRVECEVRQTSHGSIP